jgi:hypothetical protein
MQKTELKSEQKLANRRQNCRAGKTGQKFGQLEPEILTGKTEKRERMQGHWTQPNGALLYTRPVYTAPASANPTQKKRETERALTTKETGRERTHFTGCSDTWTKSERRSGERTRHKALGAGGAAA